MPIKLFCLIKMCLKETYSSGRIAKYSMRQNIRYWNSLILKAHVCLPMRHSSRARAPGTEKELVQLRLEMGHTTKEVFIAQSVLFPLIRKWS